MSSLTRRAYLRAPSARDPRRRRPPDLWQTGRPPVPEETLTLRPGEQLVVKRADPDVLEVEAEWHGGGDRPPAHYHPAQDERFEVLAGALHCDRGQGEEVFRAGEAFDVPRRMVHRMWATEPTRAAWRVRPRLRTLDFFRAVDALHRRDPDPSALAFAPLLRDFGDVFRVSRVPRPAIRLMAATSRVRRRR
jgi:mannose-6-phosphate isomerase-like protein (cupin superfamily)